VPWIDINRTLLGKIISLPKREDVTCRNEQLIVELYSK